MKNMKTLVILALVSIALASCDQNEIMPSYSKKGTATATVATITPSKTRATQSESITITLKYVNPTSDPLQNVTLKAKIGSADYSTIQTIDTQSGMKDAEVTRDITYITPAAAGTVTFDMVITSQKEYPQIKRATVTIQ